MVSKKEVAFLKTERRKGRKGRKPPPVGQRLSAPVPFRPFRPFRRSILVFTEELGVDCPAVSGAPACLDLERLQPAGPDHPVDQVLCLVGIQAASKSHEVR